MIRTLILCGCWVLLAANAQAADTTTLINSQMPPVLVKKTSFPFQAKGIKDASKVKVRLKQVAAVKNGITDDEEWFHKNILPHPPEAVEEDFRYVPAETRWGILKFFRSSDDGRHIAIYEKARVRPEAKEEKGFSAIYDKSYNYSVVVFSADYSPEKLILLEDIYSGILKMNNAHFVGNTLYLDCNYNGYASLAKKKTGYLAALDVKTGQVLWTTKALTSGYRGFLVYKDVIFTGYGFTEEPDFLFVINRHTGKVLQKLKLKSAHSFIIVKAGKLYVRTYDHDHLFTITEK
jgi:hypothetical protein